MGTPSSFYAGNQLLGEFDDIHDAVIYKLNSPSLYYRVSYF